MKPAAFKYVRVDSVEAALSALEQYGSDAKILAGGQSLVPMMNFRIAQPSVLVDINPVNEIDFIRAENGWLCIGARTRQTTLEKNPDVNQKCPLLAAAVKWIGHPQIRNRGTLGGSLVHGDPTAELALVATLLDARLVIRSTAKSRTVGPADFFDGFMSTRITETEILTEVRYPAAPPGSGYGFHELCIRQGDFAVVAAAVQFTADDVGLCTEARVAVSGAGPKPLRIPAAEKILAGSDASAAVLDAAAACVPAELQPMSDLKGSEAYRREMARIFVRRALADAWSMAREKR
ncbi:MAG: xanthine dehydrogenase family protein subunit M [Deltaproteobacteria bacterium]|nr:xanthine dehydrogenase family protein subunit M [Deltaproteobacteria bacterium]